jgi:hypothetical protein
MLCHRSAGSAVVAAGLMIAETKQRRRQRKTKMVGKQNFLLWGTNIEVSFVL